MKVLGFLVPAKGGRDGRRRGGGGVRSKTFLDTPETRSRSHFADSPRRFRVLKLGANKIKLAKPELETRNKNAASATRLSSSLFARDNGLRGCNCNSAQSTSTKLFLELGSPCQDHEERSTDPLAIIQKYFSKSKPFYNVKVSARFGEKLRFGILAEPTGIKLVTRRLRKSRSASSVRSPPYAVVPERRDGTLVEKEDGIEFEGAIAHWLVANVLSVKQLLQMSDKNPTPSPSPSPAQSWPSDSHRTVICIGDIHGYFSKLLRLWSALQSAVPATAFDTSLIIFLGDYCDRGPQTRQVLDFLIGLPAKYPRQRHVFLCGNHDLAFAAFVGALPARGDGSARWDDTWEEYALSEEREGWYKGEGYAEMHVQGRRWAGTVNRFNAKKGMAYKGSIYDSAPTFESYGVPHASPDLVKAVPDEHKKFLRDLVWVHEEENVAIDTEQGRMNCRLIAVHAGLEKTKEVQERLQVLRDRDSSLHTVQELRGRMNVWDIPKDLLENPMILVSGHHGKLHIDGLRFIIDESGGLEHLPIAAIVFPSQKVVRDNDS